MVKKSNSLAELLTKGITKPAIRRLSKRGNVNRLQKCMYEGVREHVTTFVEKLVQNSLRECQKGNRKLILNEDVETAMKDMGLTMPDVPLDRESTVNFLQGHVEKASSNMWEKSDHSAQPTETTV